MLLYFATNIPSTFAYQFNIINANFTFWTTVGNVDGIRVFVCFSALFFLCFYLDHLSFLHTVQNTFHKSNILFDVGLGILLYPSQSIYNIFGEEDVLDFINVDFTVSVISIWFYSFFFSFLFLWFIRKLESFGHVSCYVL